MPGPQFILRGAKRVFDAKALYAQLVVTDDCNLSCSYCIAESFVGAERKGLTLPQVCRLIDEAVEIAKGRDHDHALAVPGEEVVRDRVALTGRVITVERDGALPIEVPGRLVLIEVREDRRQRLAPLDDVGRVCSLAAHEHCEARVDGEQCFLALGVAPIRAVGVGVEELSKSKSIIVR